MPLHTPLHLSSCWAALLLSPERLVPRGRDTDRRSEVYSLGATLYEIGMPGCTLYVSTDDAVTLTNRGGRTTWSVT